MCAYRVPSRVGRALLAAALASFLGPAALAVDIDGTTVVVRVAMHGPGKLGTQWRTDVWVSDRSALALTVTLNFYPTSGTPLSTTVDIGPYSVVELPDIVLATFGLDNAKGMLIASVEGTTPFEMHARIYNTGSPVGQFGQFAPGIGKARLERQAHIYGVSGVDGNRTNVGIANPNDVAFDVVLRMESADHTTPETIIVHLGPYELKQIDDIFAATGFTAQGNAQVEINTALNETPIYGYASVVRNDTGDAIFIFGSGPNV